MSKIPEKMKAVICHGPHDYRLEEIPVPEIGPEDILIEVEACGICAGDVKSFKGASMFWGGDGMPQWNKPPVVAGHEFIGTVARMGDQAAEKYDFGKGKKIIAEQIVPCGECRYCRRGEYWMCEVHNIHGHQKDVADGGMAEYMKFSGRDIIHEVPDDFTAAQGVMIEPLSCSVHTVERADISFGDTVVVAGLGPIGLCKLQLARLKNPGQLIGLDLKEKRLELGKKLGADKVFNPAKEDVIKKVKDLTDGYGCDVYIHNTGAPEGVKQGLQMLRKLGTFVEFSVFSDTTDVDWSIIGDRKELNIYGSHISPYTYPAAIDFLDKDKVKVEDIVTHKFALEDFKEAFKLAERGEESIKVALIP
ncbi:MAG: zinc-binding dehydrogenase [Halanaerobiaceae bacterium]